MSRYRTKRGFRERLLPFLAALLLLLGIPAVTTVVTASPAAADATHQVAVDMPFTGKWAYNANVNPPWTDSNSSHPSVHHTPGGGDWATDLYGAEGAAVKLNVSAATGTVSFTWNTSSTSCGQSTRINVLIGGVTVGWIYFAHIDNAVTSGPISNGMTIGTVHNWGGCNPGTHIHVEYKNTSNYSCWVGHGNPGTSLNEGDHIGVLGSTNTGAKQECASVPGGSGGGSTNNTVLKVIKQTDSGSNLVFWAKAGTVFETSWTPGGNGPQHAQLVSIPQQDIKDIDVQINADHQRLVYTAAGEHIYETWYYAGQAIHTAPIVQNAGNVKRIQKTVGPSGEQQLYVMTDQGVDEYWWWPGGQVHGSRVYTIANPVAMEKMPTKPDGTQILYVADKSYVYENWWRPGEGPYTGGVVMYIPQADITDLDVSVDADGRHRAYVGRDHDGVWEAAWYRGSPVYTRQITGDNGVRDIEKYMDGSTHVIYLATQGGVFEYWWQGDGTVSGGVIAQLTDVHSIDRATTADGLPAVYTGANTSVYESWWGTGNSPATASIA